MRTDDRLSVAVRIAGGPVDTPVIQSLAGGPQLVGRYEELRRDDDPLARMRLACLNAAVDLRRVGWGEPIPDRALRTAAEYHLGPTDQLDEGLYALALHEPERPYAATGEGLLDQQLGVPALSCWVSTGPDLAEVPRYRIHDYLFEHVSAARRLEKVPSALWWVAASNSPSETDAAALADSAFTRAIWYLDGRLNETGYERLQLLEKLGGIPGTYSQDRFSQADDAEAFDKDFLFTMLAARGDLDRLAVWSDLGYDNASMQLARSLMLRGDLNGLKSRRSYHDNFFAPRYARTLALRGDVAALRTEAGFTEDDEDAAGWLDGVGPYEALDNDAAEWLSKIEEAEAIELALRYWVDSSDEGPRYARALAWLGDVRTLTVRADSGDADAAFRLGEVLAARNDTKTLRERFIGGDLWAGHWLAQVDAALQNVRELEILAQAGVFEAATLLALTLDVHVGDGLDEDEWDGS